MYALRLSSVLSGKAVMSIHDKDLFDKSRYEVALERIRAYTNNKKVLCAFSGGKDSQCCYHLLKDAGVEFHAEYSITRFEPPELLKFIRANYPDVTFRRAYKMSLVDEIAYSGLPNMWARWCCEAKHTKTVGYDIAVIGIRWEESAKRRNTWRMFGFKPDKTAYLCPICDWTTADVWEYLGDRPHCSLYDEGYTRIGCVCCPLSPSKLQADAKRWPKTAAMLKMGVDRFVSRMRDCGYKTKKGNDCWDWYKSDNPEEAYWNRWLAKGHVTNAEVPVDEPCLFEGTGFSEKDSGEIVE